MNELVNNINNPINNPWTDPDPEAAIGEDWIIYNDDPIPTILDLENIRKEIEQNIFINNTISNLVYMTEILLKAKKYINDSFNHSSYNVVYNDIILFLENTVVTTTEKKKNLHNLILSKIDTVNNTNLFYNKDGPHIILRCELERQFNVSYEDKNAIYLYDLLGDIRRQLRDQFLLREFYLVTIRAEYADIKHQMIKLELIRYKSKGSSNVEIAIEIVLTVLRLRYFHLTNDMNMMMKYIKNINYSPAQKFYSTFLYNNDITGILYNLKCDKYLEHYFM